MGLARRAGREALSVGANHEVYEVAIHASHLMVIGFAFAAFAAVYRALEASRRGPSRPLGRLHFATTFIAAGLVLSPALLVPRLPPPADPVAAFAQWNLVAAAGYLLALAGQTFFVAVLIDAFRTRPHLG